MEICRACLGLRGPVADGLTQRCACERAEPLWPGYDYNRTIELCRCCGAKTVPSGSRWSLFFCETCHAAVLAHNRVDDRVIPIGRHSLMMNGRLPCSDELDRWHRERVSAVVRGIPGAERTVPLETYLAHARARVEDVAALVAALASRHSGFGIIEALGLEDIEETDDPIERAEQFAERLAAAITASARRDADRR
jgi:hypothetical protein